MVFRRVPLSISFTYDLVPGDEDSQHRSKIKPYIVSQYRSHGTGSSPSAAPRMAPRASMALNCFGSSLPDIGEELSGDRSTSTPRGRSAKCRADLMRPKLPRSAMEEASEASRPVGRPARSALARIRDFFDGNLFHLHLFHPLACRQMRNRGRKRWRRASTRTRSWVTS